MNNKYVEEMTRLAETFESISNTMTIIADSLLESQKAQQQLMIDINRLNDRMDRIEAKLDKVVS
jgi:methyl-accepting chemotaxis protein